MAVPKFDRCEICDEPLDPYCFHWDISNQALICRDCREYLMTEGYLN